MITRTFQRLRKNSREKSWKKYPRGSLVFVEKLQGSHRTAEQVKPEIEALREAINFDKLWILHGIAFKKNGITTVVCGPAG